MKFRYSGSFNQNMKARGKMIKKRGLVLLLVLGLLVTSLFGFAGTSFAGCSINVITYVQPGDTLKLISDRYGVSVDELMQANNLQSSMIYVGQPLVIPQKSTIQGAQKVSYKKYVVKQGDTLYLIAKSLGTTVNKLVSINNLKSYDVYVGQVLYVPAVAATPVPQPQPKPQPQPQPQPAPVAGMTADEQQMLSLVNQERAKAGLPGLQADMNIVKVARLKAKDMINLNYFDHTSPTYGSPFDMMKQFGIAYGYAGENLAGAGNVQSAHTNLMNSPGHRANILNVNYNKVGIGIVDGGPYGKMFVQMFTD